MIITVLAQIPVRAPAGAARRSHWRRGALRKGAAFPEDTGRSFQKPAVENTRAVDFMVRDSRYAPPLRANRANFLFFI